MQSFPSERAEPLETNMKKTEKKAKSTYDELMQNPEFQKKHEKSYRKLVLSEIKFKKNKERVIL